MKFGGMVLLYIKEYKFDGSGTVKQYHRVRLIVSPLVQGIEPVKEVGGWVPPSSSPV